MGVGSPQPIELTYGQQPGETGLVIPPVSRFVGGGTALKFTGEVEDPFHHHADGGGWTVVNGDKAPSGSPGFDVSGKLSVWGVDFWSLPFQWDPATGLVINGPQATELQIWAELKQINPDGSTGVTVNKFKSVEFQMPPQHDDILWDANGNVSKDQPGHSPNVRHMEYTIGRWFVPRDNRLWLYGTQFHDALKVPPPWDKPYPGHFKSFDLYLGAWPR